MSKLSAQEATDLLLGYELEGLNYFDQPYTHTVSDFRDYWDEEVTEADFPGVGQFQVVETRGGEGAGDTATVVFRFVPDEGDVQYFRIDGSYSSFGDGADFSYRNLREVRLVERVVKFYE